MNTQYQQSWQQAIGLDKLKYGDTIARIFELMFETWMDDSDKIDFVKMLFNQTGQTLEKMNADIETGVNNGYSADKQLEIITKFAEKTAPN